MVAYTHGCPEQCKDPRDCPVSPRFSAKEKCGRYHTESGGDDLEGPNALVVLGEYLKKFRP